MITQKQALEARIQQLESGVRRFSSDRADLMKAYAAGGTRMDKDRADTALREAEKCRNEMNELKKQLEGLSEQASS